jgi:small subunit ribosomal protein S2
MGKIPQLADMLQAGMHFGHQTSKWHPKMKKFIFGSRQGIHIINLEETQKAMEEVFGFARKTAGRGGVVLFVGTKKQAAPLVEAAAKACGMPYVNERWLGGTLTNFSSIAAQIRKYKDLKRKQEKGELGKYTKFEQLKIAELIKILEKKIGGIQDMTRIPDALFIFDVKKDKTALDEATKRGVKVIAVCDSNVDPSDIDFPIPANDDAVKAIAMTGDLMAQAINDGKKDWESNRARLGGSLVPNGQTMNKAFAEPVK